MLEQTDTHMPDGHVDLQCSKADDDWRTISRMEISEFIAFTCEDDCRRCMALDLTAPMFLQKDRLTTPRTTRLYARSTPSIQLEIAVGARSRTVTKVT